MSPSPLAGRPVELPGGQLVPSDDLTAEVKALAELLAEVVTLAGDSALFPSRWNLIAELALEHVSVRAALRAEGKGGGLECSGADPPLGTELIIAQLNSLRDLIGDDRVQH